MSLVPSCSANIRADSDCANVAAPASGGNTIFPSTGIVCRGSVFRTSGSLVTAFECDGGAPWLSVIRAVAEYVGARRGDVHLFIDSQVVDVLTCVDSLMEGCSSFNVVQLYTAPTLCSSCGVELDKPRLVWGGCRLTQDCGKECQLADYKGHNPLCRGTRIAVLAGGKHSVVCKS